ncbi:MAG: crotonase/enoyl-CoA hydratase family protein [Pseudomonadota bacterium]
MNNTIRIDIDARGVATLWLARAEKHNAMDAVMIAEIAAAAADLGANGDVRVVVLRAEGRSFCAGGDLGWMRDQMGADRATRMAQAAKLASMLGALEALPKPLIALAQGNAFGGGVGLLAVADLALCVESARFGLSEVRLGLIPATIGPYVVAKLGPKAREVFFSARLFAAPEAVRLGLLSRAVPETDAEAALEAEIAPYLSAAPGAVIAAKSLARSLAGRVSAKDVEMSITALADQWETDEAREGIAAFFDKRKTNWDLM